MANYKYGIWQERDLDIDSPLDSADPEALLDAQQETLEQHNSDINAYVGIFAEQVTTVQKAVQGGITGVRSQPLDELGRPRPIKGGSQYFVGFPIWKSGNAHARDFWTGKQMSVKDYADAYSLMLLGDVEWMKDQMFAALFYNGGGYTWKYSDRNVAETAIVYGLANGDGIVYDATGGAATDNHYAGQAAAIDATHNPFSGIYTELAEHKVNGSRVVSFVSTDQSGAIELLPNFSPAPQFVPIVNVIPGDGTARPDPAVAPALGIPLSSSMTYLGVCGNCYIVQWNNLPAGTIVSVAVDAEVKPLAMRQYPQTVLQGFIDAGDEPNKFPFEQRNYVRAAGFGGYNRVAAHVYTIGSGSYVVPGSYTFPLA